MTDCVS